MVVLDASVLLLLLDPDASPPKDLATGQPVDQAKARIEHLVVTLERQRTKVIIPTPVLSEVLVRAGDAAPAYLEELSKSARFKIADFDMRAAVELAALTREALDAGDKSEGSTAPWQKVKLTGRLSPSLEQKRPSPSTPTTAIFSASPSMPGSRSSA